MATTDTERSFRVPGPRGSHMAPEEDYLPSIEPRPRRLGWAPGVLRGGGERAAVACKALRAMYGLKLVSEKMSCWVRRGWPPLLRGDFIMTTHLEKIPQVTHGGKCIIIIKEG